MSARPDDPAAAALTIVSANLFNPWFNKLRVDPAALLNRLEALARLLERQAADIVLCQEVGRGAEFRVDEWLSRRLSMAAIYVEANRRAIAAPREEGLAILSRYPLSDVSSTQLGGRLWRRSALGAVVATPLGELAVYSAHLGLRPWLNRRQARQLREWAEQTAAGRTAVIGGDFNATEASPQIRMLAGHWSDAFRAAHPAAAGATHELKLFGRVLRRQRIDYLFLRPGANALRLLACDHVPPSTTVPPFSDHALVVGRFGGGL